MNNTYAINLVYKGIMLVLLGTSLCNTSLIVETGVLNSEKFRGVTYMGVACI